MSIGGRVKQARKMARLSMAELAARAGVSAQAISNYERDEDTPRPTVMLRLAKALKVDPGFLLRTTEVQLSCPRYRKRSTFGVREREAVEEQVRERLDRYLEVESLFPPGWFDPQGLTAADMRAISSVEQAELVAADLRQRWGLGTAPIEKLAEALEDRGIKVIHINAPDGFDGLACWANDTVPVIVVNANKLWDRQRFDMAHELGELILKPEPEVNAEKAAHRFAGAFLVPREIVLRELGRTRHTLDFEELALLKHEYGLSMQAWARRALDVGVLSDAAYGTFCRRLSADGRRKDEQTGPRDPEHARRFELLVHQAESEGLITLAHAAELLGQAPAPSRAPATEDEIRAATAASQRYYKGNPDEAELAAFAGDDMAD